MTKLMNIIGTAMYFLFCSDKATFVNKHYIIKGLYQDTNDKTVNASCILLIKVITSLVNYLFYVSYIAIQFLGKVDINRLKISIQVSLCFQ